MTDIMEFKRNMDIDKNVQMARLQRIISELRSRNEELESENINMHNRILILEDKKGL